MWIKYLVVLSGLVFRCCISPLLQSGSQGRLAVGHPWSGPRCIRLNAHHRLLARVVNANPLQVSVHLVQTFLSPSGTDRLDKCNSSHQHQQKCYDFHNIDATISEWFIRNIQKTIVLIFRFCDISVDAVRRGGGSAAHYEIREDVGRMENEYPAGFFRRNKWQCWSVKES